MDVVIDMSIGNKSNSFVRVLNRILYNMALIGHVKIRVHFSEPMSRMLNILSFIQANLFVRNCCFRVFRSGANNK